MAKTRTSHIGNMVSGEVADDTREIYRITSDIDVLSAVDSYDKYFAEFEAWLEEAGNEGKSISVFQAKWESEHKHKVPEFAAVADRDNISDPESVFVEVRFFEVHSDGSKRSAINAPWCQMNSTNINGLVAGDFAIFTKVFNARRAYLGLNPA